MADKNRVLFLNIARRSYARGEHSHAIICLINVLKQRPDLAKTNPEYVDFLAEIISPKFEEELSRLYASHPKLGEQFLEALEKEGKLALKERFERSFERYCIEQFKMTRRSAQSSSCETVPSYPRFPSAAPAFEVPRPSSPSYPRFPSAAPAFEAPRPSSPSYPRPWAEAARRTEARLLSQGVQFQRPNSTQTSGEEDRENIHRLAARVLEQTQAECKMPSMRSSTGQLFARLQTQSSDTETSAELYQELPNMRCIIDFDKRIPLCKNKRLSESLTPFRSYQEDLLQLRQERQRPNFSTNQLNPSEILAETACQWGARPAAQNHRERHPLRFKVAPRALVLCVMLCFCTAFAMIAWQNASASIEHMAVQALAERYFDNAQGREHASFESALSENLVSSQFLEAYRLFIAAWQDEHWLGPTPLWRYGLASDETKKSAPSLAAYVMSLLSQAKIEEAEAFLANSNASIWRAHPYFYQWSQAQLEEARGQSLSAAQRYERLLSTPLSPFALTRLAVLALETEYIDVASRLLRQAKAIEKGPVLAQCAYAILLQNRGQHSDLHFEGMERLKAKYRLYCHMARLGEHLAHQIKPLLADHQALLEAEALPRFEKQRQLYLSASFLALGGVSEAAERYRALRLPAQDPERQRLRSALYQHAARYAQWEILGLMSPKPLEQLQSLEALHAMDHGLETKSSYWAERLFLYNPKPAKRALLARRGKEGIYDAWLDKAYQAALEGRFELAIHGALSLRNAHPSRLEPVFVHAMALAQSGRALEAAMLLENRSLAEQGNLAFSLWALVYRARAGQKLPVQALLLPLLRFQDPSLEALRCELLWRHAAPQAKACLLAAAQAERPSKAVLLILAMAGHRQYSSDMLYALGAEAMSFPGYHRLLAQQLEREGKWRQSARAYERSILWERLDEQLSDIYQAAALYRSHAYRYEGRKRFEKLIARAEAARFQRASLAALHLNTALLYHPKSGHPSVLKHLQKARELGGDNEVLIRAYIQYYAAKDKPEQLYRWRQRLRAFQRQRATPHG